jgi:hypothetical protein
VSRKPSMSAAARERAYRRHLRKELERVSALAALRLREAVEAGWIEGRVEDNGEVVIEVEALPPAPTRRSQR